MFASHGNRPPALCNLGFLSRSRCQLYTLAKKTLPEGCCQSIFPRAQVTLLPFRSPGGLQHLAPPLGKHGNGLKPPDTRRLDWRTSPALLPFAAHQRCWMFAQSCN